MIYLDDSSTTQIDSRVLKSMQPYLTEFYGNSSSTHSFGQKSRFAIDEARYTIADYIKCMPQEIVFTSTGSESISLALKGTAEYLSTLNGNFEPQNIYFITSPLEHSSVIKTISHLQFWGYQNRVLRVDNDGKIVLDSLKEEIENIISINPNARIIVTVQYVNSEIGTIQDINSIIKISHNFGAIVHTDAMQAAKLLDISNLGVDMMTFAAHKIYGPLGAAALYLKSGSKISRQIDGGEQEYKIRAGTQNVPAIVGFGKSVELLVKEKEERNIYISKLSQIFVNELKNSIQDIRVLCENNRMSSINAILFPNIKSTEFLVRLDLAGVYASAGSACNSGSIQPTENLSSIGLNEDEINSVIRFSIGKNNTEEEIYEACRIIKREYSAYTNKI